MSRSSKSDVWTEPRKMTHRERNSLNYWELNHLKCNKSSVGSNWVSEAGGQTVSCSHKQKAYNRDASVFQTGWRGQNITKHLQERILVPDSNRIFMRGAWIQSVVCVFLTANIIAALTRQWRQKSCTKVTLSIRAVQGKAPQESANPWSGDDLFKQALNSPLTRGNLRRDVEGDVVHRPLSH